MEKTQHRIPREWDQKTHVDFRNNSEFPELRLILISWSFLKMVGLVDGLRVQKNLNLSFIESFGKEKRFTGIDQIGMNFQITSKRNGSTIFYSHNEQLWKILCLDSGIHGPKRWTKAKQKYDGPTRTTRSLDLAVRESLALIINFLETFLCSTTGS